MDLRTGVYILSLFYSVVLSAGTPDVSMLRKMMSGARGSEVTANAFHKETKTFDKDPLLLGFRAMSELLLCDHTTNVLSKYAHFKEGKKLLEEAIKKDTLNPELIYFRFTTQTSAPRMLGYYQQIATDKIILLGFLNNGKTRDRELYDMIKTFLLNSGDCTKEEKNLIKKMDER